MYICSVHLVVYKMGCDQRWTVTYFTLGFFTATFNSHNKQNRFRLANLKIAAHKLDFCTNYTSGFWIHFASGCVGRKVFKCVYSNLYVYRNKSLKTLYGLLSVWCVWVCDMNAVRTWLGLSNAKLRSRTFINTNKDKIL